MHNNTIWLLLDSCKAGGIESHVLQLAEGLQQHGETIEVIFLTDYGPHPMRDSLLSLGINNRTLDGRFKSLCKVLNKDRPTVLHTHGYKAGILGRLAAKINGIASISTYHAGEISAGKLALYDWLDRKSARLADQLFAVSPQIAKRLPGKVDVFNNFVNISNVTPSTGQQIAFVGRVSLEKGPDYFLELATHFPDIHFHLYGDGPYLPTLKAVGQANLYLHGQQDEMLSVWPKIVLLVIPSRYEGLPMVALEAMARGIPVVAFNVGALERLIIPEVNGWLIEPENILQLSQRINWWNNVDEQQKSKLKSACKNTIKRQFSSAIAIPKLVENYENISK